jgi:glycosyltransferase involved in cell wall biosynthesis
MKEVIFFSNGDPESAQTWSNVPKCFVDTLRKKGVVVHPVSLANESVQSIYDNFFRRVLKVLLSWYDEPRYYGYTWLHQWLGNRRVKKAVETWPQADYCFFINYGFYNRYSKIPSLLLSDWTDVISLRRRDKPVARFQKRFCSQQQEAIEQAEHVISIFPLCAEEMRHLYPTAHIHYLGGNVINDLSGEALQPEEILHRKKESRRILFVGKPDRYKESAIKLIEAVGLLRSQQEYADWELDIIGIGKGQLSFVPDYVHCHGFLHKDNPEECKKYYELLKGAKMIVNPTPKWAAYSSIIEAMYFYTPVVVSPFDDFVQEFGKEIGFGRYNKVFTGEGIAENVQAVIEATDYENLCRCAHSTVNDYTWDRYVDKILSLIQKS